MDLATIIGLVMGFGLIGWAIMGAAHEADASPAAFMSMHATMIVFGGSLASVFISFPLNICLRGPKVFLKLLLCKTESPVKLIDDLVKYAEIARRDGILSLENVTRTIKDPFIVKGIQMATDGTDPEVIESIMFNELEAISERHAQGKAMFEAMGKYAPAYGLIGTLIGLVMMLLSLDDPSKIGPGMALGLLGTMYGTALANVLALPFSEKLIQRHNEELMLKTIVIKGIISIQSGDNPRIVEHRLKTFLPPSQRKMSDANQK